MFFKCANLMAANLELADFVVDFVVEGVQVGWEFRRKHFFIKLIVSASFGMWSSSGIGRASRGQKLMYVQIILIVILMFVFMFFPLQVLCCSAYYLNVFSDVFGSLRMSFDDFLCFFLELLQRGCKTKQNPSKNWPLCSNSKKNIKK